MSTIENNKLIAEFMGATIRMTDMNPENNTVFLSGETYFQDRLKYHTSWDWLMPVVEKIDELMPDDSMVQISFNRCVIDNYEWAVSWDIIENSRIDATYKAVVEFIKWYNEQNRFICGSCGEHYNSYEYNEKTDVDECPDCQIKNK